MLKGSVLVEAYVVIPVAIPSLGSPETRASTEHQHLACYPPWLTEFSEIVGRCCRKYRAHVDVAMDQSDPRRTSAKWYTWHCSWYPFSSVGVELMDLDDNATPKLAGLLVNGVCLLIFHKAFPSSYAPVNRASSIICHNHEVVAILESSPLERQEF